MQNTFAQILVRLKKLNRNELALQAEFLRHMVKLQEERGYADLGFSSLFTLCTRGLGLSSPAAGVRVTVAHLAIRVPAVLNWLARGETNLTSLRLLAKALTVENAEEVLGKAKGLCTREVEALAAAYAPPEKKKRDIVRPFHPEPEAGEEAARSNHVPEANKEGARSDHIPKPTKETETSPDKHVPRLFPDPPLPQPDYRVSVTLSAKTMEKIERARALASARMKHGDWNELLDLVLDAFIAENDPSLKPARKVEPKEPASHSRYIPRDARRKVWERDRGQCTFVSPVTGKRCQEKHHLQIDHIIPFARGGSSTDPRNLRLLCRTHNLWRARRDFGSKHVELQRVLRLARRRCAPVSVPDSRGAGSPRWSSPDHAAPDT